MRGAITAERIKVTSTKLWWILILVGIGMTILLGVLPNTLIQEDGALETAEGINALWGSLGFALVIALIVGIMSMTGEYRHKTITESFLLEPSRPKFLSAKIVVQAVLGGVLALACAVGGVALTLALISGKSHAAIDWVFVGQVTLGVVIAYALYAVLGVAVGALIPNQAFAIVAALLWVILIEPLASGLLPQLSFIPDGAGKWFPGSAAQAIIDGVTPPTQDGIATELLPMWGGVLVLVAYAVALTAIAIRTTLRKDIT